MKHLLIQDCCLIQDTVIYEQLAEIEQSNKNIEYWINDQAIEIFDTPKKFYTVPAAAAYFGKKVSAITLPPIIDTKVSFNFCIDKKQINRYLLIKLVELFGFADYNYTWSGAGREFDMSMIIQEWNQTTIADIDQDIKSFLLSPIAIEQKWCVVSNSVANDLWVKQGLSRGNHNHTIDYVLNLWTQCLCSVIASSAVSLIGESVQYQKMATITEKSLFPIAGLTMPIWVGGYGIPDSMKKIGFDVFDDVIDHSYQYRETLIERCFYSVFLNRHLLNDSELAKKLRIKNQHRLVNNFRLLQSGILDIYCQNTIATFPHKVQQMIKQYRLQYH